MAFTWPCRYCGEPTETLRQMGGWGAVPVCLDKDACMARTPVPDNGGGPDS